MAWGLNSVTGVQEMKAEILVFAYVFFMPSRRFAGIEEENRTTATHGVLHKLPWPVIPLGSETLD